MEIFIFFSRWDFSRFQKGKSCFNDQGRNWKWQKCVSFYTLTEHKVKIVRPYYDPKTGELKGLYETIRYLVVRSSPEEYFFNYGFHREKSKILYSHCRQSIPNSFSGAIFNRHHTMIGSGEVDNEFSNIYFFLPASTDRVTYQYLQLSSAGSN